MPRTKVARTMKPIGVGNAEKQLELFRVYAKLVENRLSEQFEVGLKKLNEHTQMFLASISDADRKKTIKQLREEAEYEAFSTKRSSRHVSRPSKMKKRSLSSTKDDGYVTEGAPHYRSRASRSLSRSAIKTSNSGYAGKGSMGPPSSWRGRRARSPSSVSRQRYCTPMQNRSASNDTFPTVTPKVAPNTPLTVLRRPRQGEMVMSFSGSPLLVNSISTIDDKPNCNIPLKDGTMLAIMPSKLRQSTELPLEQMSSETLRYLEVLCQNLGVVVSKDQTHN